MVEHNFDKNKMLDLKQRMSIEQGDREKPFLSFSRHSFWHNEPCYFCSSTEGIKERLGRYVSSGEFEDIQVIFFCGLCHSKMEKHFDLDME